jgi:hypothetical protein
MRLERLLPATCRDNPYEPQTPLCLAEFSGRAEAVCPRGTLRRVLDRAAESAILRSSRHEMVEVRNHLTPLTA